MICFLIFGIYLSISGGVTTITERGGVSESPQPPAPVKNHILQHVDLPEEPRPFTVLREEDMDGFSTIFSWESKLVGGFNPSEKY